MSPRSGLIQRAAALVLPALLAAALLSSTGRADDGPPPADAAAAGQDVLFLGDDGPVFIRLHIRIDGRSVEEVWNDSVDRIFAGLDRDGDGVLSAEEVAGLPTAEQMVQSGLLPPQQAQAGGVRLPNQPSLPRGADGRVTRLDLADWLRRIGLVPFAAQVAAAPQQTRALVVSGRAATGSTAGDRLFDLLDADGDGRLSPDEFQQAIGRLHKFDADDDGLISAAEIGPMQNPFGGVVIESGPRQAVPQPSFLVLSAGESPMNLARQILQRYDRPPADNKLSRDEFKLPADAFERYDADGDGHLDFDELAQLVRDPMPQVALVVRIGRRDRREPLLEALPVEGEPAAQVRTTDDLATLVLGTVQVEVGAEQSVTAEGFERGMLAQFQQADTDGNGYVDREEAQRSFIFRQAFDQIDRDGDGMLYEEEVLAFARQQFALASARTVLNVTDQGQNLFQILDLNRDGRLSAREFAAAVERLPLWDEDGDGLLSRSEIPRHFRLTVGRGRTTFGGLATAPAPVAGVPGRRPAGAGPAWFQKMDRNGDGEVSRREFLGTDEQFRRLDTNGDGVIDAAEAAAALGAD